MTTDRRALRLAVPTVLAVVALIAAGCGSDSDSGSGSGASDTALTVTATTTQVADLVRNVGGDRVTVEQLLQPNSDPHGYEPRPSDVRALAGSALVFRSGGDLDEWLSAVVDNAGGDAATVDLSESVDVHSGDDDHGRADEDGHADDDHADDDEHADDHVDDDHAADDDHADHGRDEGADDHGHDHGEEDPHWWQDPRNAIAAVGAIEAALIEADPDGRAEYEANAAAYVERLETLDREVAACIDRIPAADRKLVTTHDALGYYADRYGIETVGALIPSQSTAAQPSAGDTRALVEQIRAQGVRAIFPESSLSPRLERAVARETGARVGRALWADALGGEDSDGATYVDSIASNTEAIVDGLTGGEVACRPDA